MYTTSRHRNESSELIDVGLSRRQQMICFVCSRVLDEVQSETHVRMQLSVPCLCK